MSVFVDKTIPVSTLDSNHIPNTDQIVEQISEDIFKNFDHELNEECDIKKEFKNHLIRSIKTDIESNQINPVMSKYIDHLRSDLERKSALKEKEISDYNKGCLQIVFAFCVVPAVVEVVGIVFYDVKCF
jgi:hypothetical protein